MGTKFTNLQERQLVEQCSHSELIQLKRGDHFSQSMHSLEQDEQDYIKDYFEHEISAANDPTFTESLVSLVKHYMNWEIKCTKESEEEYNKHAMVFKQQYCGAKPQCDWESLNSKLNFATSLLENVENVRNEHQLFVEVEAIMQVKWSFSDESL
eukprot:553580_1